MKQRIEPISWSPKTIVVLLSIASSADVVVQGWAPGGHGYLHHHHRQKRSVASGATQQPPQSSSAPPLLQSHHGLSSPQPCSTIMWRLFTTAQPLVEYHDEEDLADIPKYAKPRDVDESLLGDMTGGRPGAIVETEEQLAIKDQMLLEIEHGERQYPANIMDSYGDLLQDTEAEYDNDDPDALDVATLGSWTIQDLKSKFDYEWDPLSGEPDPNWLELQEEGVRYLKNLEMDDDGVEVGYDPIFGPSNPMDHRTILGSRDSFMIDERTRDESLLTPQFDTNDPEIAFNQDFVRFRKSLDILETYVDPFMPNNIELPRHVAKWHGYPEQTCFAPKNFTNNRFTEAPTDFNVLTPFRARQLAVEMARSKNAEWLPDGVSQHWHQEQRKIYDDYGTIVGTLRKGECDPDIVQAIQPALKILDGCVDLLSIQDGIFRFEYYGLMKNKYGMSCWTQTLIEDCGVEVSNVVFETGFRKRDPAYDGGDAYNGPLWW